MRSLMPLFVVLTAAMQGTGHGQDWISPFDRELPPQPVITSSFHNWMPLADRSDNQPNLLSGNLCDVPLLGFAEQPRSIGSDYFLVRGQDDGESSGGAGAGAAAATDPSVPLTQLQLQNQFVPSTYNAGGLDEKKQKGIARNAGKKRPELDTIATRRFLLQSEHDQCRRRTASSEAPNRVWNLGYGRKNPTSGRRYNKDPS